MEEDLTLLRAIKREFDCANADLRAYSPLALAFVGDSVYDLLIRTIVVERGATAPGALHRRKSDVVRASAQAACAEALLAELTEEEMAVYRRGRNAHPHTTAKNASVGEYHRATGLEALYGFLYLTDRMDRLLYLVRRSFELTGMQV